MAADQSQLPESSKPAASAGAETAGSTPEGRRRSLLFAAILGAVILIGAVSFWLYSSTYETTDDAQVDGHLNGITSRLDGEVKAVNVEAVSYTHLTLPT